MKLQFSKMHTMHGLGTSELILPWNPFILLYRPIHQQTSLSCVFPRQIGSDTKVFSCLFSLLPLLIPRIGSDSEHNSRRAFLDTCTKQSHLSWRLLPSRLNLLFYGLIFLSSIESQVRSVSIVKTVLNASKQSKLVFL